MNKHHLTMLLGAFFASGSSMNAFAHNLGNALPHPHPHPAQWGLPESAFALLMVGSGAIAGAWLLKRRAESHVAQSSRIRCES